MSSAAYSDTNSQDIHSHNVMPNSVATALHLRFMNTCEGKAVDSQTSRACSNAKCLLRGPWLSSHGLPPSLARPIWLALAPAPCPLRLPAIFAAPVLATAHVALPR